MNSVRKTRGPRKTPRASGPDLWDRRAWCDQMGIGLVTYYSLTEKPRTVKIGKGMVRITESPAAYARRVAQLQEQELQAA